MARGTRTTEPTTRLRVILVISLVIAAACTAADDGDATHRGAGQADTEPSGESQAGTEDQPAENGTAGDDPDEGNPLERSPLQRFLGGDAGPAPVDEATRARLNDELERDLRERERLVVECMAAQGFTYHPTVPGDWSSARPGGDAWLLPEDEFAARYGFGITTIDRGEDFELMPHSPNEEMFASMSESERREWLAALYGDGSSGGFDIADDAEAAPPFDGTGEGCFGEAHEVTERTDLQAERLDAEYDALFEELGALERRIESDPRADVAARHWSDCMADGGHPGLARPGDPEQIVRDRLEQLTDGGAVADLRASDRAALQALEIELAVAELACMEDFVAATSEIRRDHEERFIEEHRAELERFRDAVTLMEQP